MSRLLVAALVVGGLFTVGCSGGKAPELGGSADSGSSDAGHLADGDGGSAGDAGAADAGCPAQFHMCADGCRPDNDINSCGTACTPCPGSAHGTATCDGTTCGLQCEKGAHLCGNDCIPEDGSSCGPDCMSCPQAPAHAFAYCDEHEQCAVGCSGDFISCANGDCGHDQGQACNLNDDCCSGHCETHACCLGLGSACLGDPDCLTYHCTGLSNMKCGTNKQCCLPAGTSCQSNSDCCSGTCSMTIPGVGLCKNG